MSKVTMATIKSFVRKNQDKLYISCLSSFDGMTDCVQQSDDCSFAPAKPTELNNSGTHTLGIRGAWFVGHSRDYFTPFSDSGFVGYEVSNCCGNFRIAVKQ